MTTEPMHPFDEAVGRLPRHEVSPQAQAEHLRMLAELAEAERTGGTRRPKRPSGRRRSLVTGITITVVLGGGIGTAAALGVFSKPTDRTTAACYGTASLTEKGNNFDFAVAAPAGGNPSESDAAAAALDICTGAWQQGRLSDTPPYARENPAPPPWDRPVPRLVVCVLPEGRVAVFPGEPETCTGLGLRVADLTEEPDSQQ